MKDAYGNLLEARAFPVFLLQLQLPNQMLDVNIHPRKEEIKFLDQANLSQLLQQAIKATLAKNDLSFQGYEEEYTFGNHSLALNDSQPKGNYTAYVLRKTTDLWNLKEEAQEKPILQVHNLYLIQETKDGLLVVDQHAAHERILYEEFKKSFENNEYKAHVQPLTPPIVFDLPVTETDLLNNHLENFQQLGFEIEPFGNNSFKVCAVPDIFQKRDIAALIAEVLDDLSQEKNPSIDLFTERTLSFLACRSAIKAGDPLSQEERKRLLEKLEETNSLYTCPHGRPVKIKLTLNDLHRLFRRI